MRPLGQRIGYVRVSTIDQNTARQLEGISVDRTFTDYASGRDVNRPQLQLCLGFVRDGDTLVVHSIDRLARNLDDLRRLVQDLTARGVRVEFVTENLTFTADASPVSTMMLTMMGCLAEFERALIRERQREGIKLAQRRGAYRGGVYKLSTARAAELRERVAAGRESKAAIARDFGIDPKTLRNYLRRNAI